jgi:hypothetical protein
MCMELNTMKGTSMGEIAYLIPCLYMYILVFFQHGPMSGDRTSDFYVYMYFYIDRAQYCT